MLSSTWDTFPAGTIELRSGRWAWRAQAAEAGVTLVYTHRQRMQDEMRAWTPERKPSLSEVTALARDPVIRQWTDAISTVWSVQMEHSPGSPRSGAHGGSHWLVFRRGARSVRALVTPDVHLGELTQRELQQLFDGT